MIALPIALAGGAGVISVVAACIPKTFTKMMNLGLEGQPKEAFQIQYRIAPLMDMAFEEGNPAGIKSLAASLMATKLSKSLAKRTTVSGNILLAVRPGTLYKITGNGLA